MCEIISKEIMRICGKMKKQFVSCLIFYQGKNKISHVSLTYCERLHVYSYLNLMLLHACKKKNLFSLVHNRIYLKILMVDKVNWLHGNPKGHLFIWEGHTKMLIQPIMFHWGWNEFHGWSSIIDSWDIYKFMYKLL